LIINVTYDSSVSAAPVGFTAAIQYAVNFLEAVLTNPVTLNIDVGWGEIDGQTVGASYLGESLESSAPAYTYTQVRNGLIAAGASAAVTTLPTSDPTGGGNFDLGTADAKALGLLAANSTAIDGWVGFYSGPGTFTFNPNDRAVSGEYDFIGIALHEITEVMGRDADLGYGSFPDSYTALDLFRYSAPGVRDLTAGGRHSIAYFSIDGGNTNLDNFNTDPSGDYGDWADSAGNDSFLAFSNSGVENAVTSADLQVMEAIGWDASELSTNETTVVYEDALFRAPDTVGLYSWAALLSTDQVTLPQLVSTFVSSGEAQNIVAPIIRLYDGLLGRAPDAAGLAAWVAAEDSGTSFTQIVQNFVTSTEFANDYGTIDAGTATQFVESLYQNFLSRAADAAGLSAYVAELGSTPTAASEAAVVLGFVNSAEFIKDVESSIDTWLTDAVDGALAGTTATTLGTATYASTLDPLYNATNSDQTIGTLVATGNDAVTFANGAYTNNLIDSLVDDGAPNTLATVTVTGAVGNELTIANIADAALTKIDASQDAGHLAVVANQNGLTILGSTGGFVLTAGGTGDTISVGSDSSESLGSATAPLGADDTINVGDAANPGGIADMWVGSNATVNLTPGATAVLYLQGDVTGAMSAGTYALTTITGAAGAGVNLTLHFYNETTGAWAGGSSVNSQVSEGTATSLANALDIAAGQAAALDQEFNGGANTTTTTISGQFAIKGSTGLVDWFQYGGNTYLVEINNTAIAAASHTALGTHDVIVEFVGIVAVNHIATQYT
jgi:hypothetical protein